MSKIGRRLASFKWAFHGLRVLFTGEFNAKIHLCATVAVILLGTVCDISKYEWLIIILVIAMVLLAEAFNTAIEQLADFVSPERRPVIKKIKDLAAGAVLLAALAALIIGVIIFAPYISRFF